VSGVSSVDWGFERSPDEGIEGSGGGGSKLGFGGGEPFAMPSPEDCN
jgi:hypothetical protein